MPVSKFALNEGEGSGLGAVGAAATRLLAADDAVADPTEFVAVTDTRIVEPTSADERTYVAPVAPAIGVHDAPPESQRCH